ncbi:Hypothetical predicted protein [Paramuricea clavata]|uniref:Uncharacterized protein n=1 Tax=Paramuricea clavata TaxID=317549 RepID=A0A7D9L8D2_PARCT|nr:Hypothetical predicted protein [Paramuricea clavata]
MTTTCATNPLKECAAITPQVAGFKVVRVLSLNCLQQADTHHGSLQFELWNAQLSEGCNSGFPHHEATLDRSILIQEPEADHCTEGLNRGVAEDVDLNDGRAAGHRSIESRVFERSQVW